MQITVLGLPAIPLSHFRSNHHELLLGRLSR